MSSHEKIFEWVPPRFDRRQGDSLVEGANNNILILGTDRPAAADSGLGHADADNGGAGAGTIHLLVGRTTVNPNFQSDDAFIYISQKTNADANLFDTPGNDLTGDLTGGTTSLGAYAKPAIIVKSDNVRLVYRNSGDLRIANEDGHSFIVISKDYIDSFAGKDLWIDVGGVKLELHDDSRVKLGPLANALSDLVDSLKTALTTAQDSGKGNLGFPVLFGQSDLQKKLLDALTSWKTRRIVNGEYIKKDG